jgi:catechol 2,3-dioxygenase-like lactoylglutathione lyase family enzyme
VYGNKGAAVQQVFVKAIKNMPQFTRVQCVLAVPDLKRSVGFYRDQLGLRLDFHVEGWAFLSRDQFRLMLGECPDAMPAHELGDHSYFAYVTVGKIDELYREFAANGVAPLKEPVNKPWGMREFLVTTPDGHRLMFGQELA